jgi:ABC-type uncharacterized transport system permease subunit
MRIQWPDVRYFIGLVAICVSGLLVSSAYHWYPGERDTIGITIWIGLSVLSFEIFIIYVVVDRLLASRDRKRRQYAYTSISRMPAMCFMDTMRLLYLTTIDVDIPERHRR